ncbi:MAG TPA: ABC transporter C-terminal domain-containing protein, partial [Gemmatimonadales bacterium]|nr:ABC transporter C-terminal domain-containing protein [Gemmatimonadales bacterium]
ATPPPPPPPPPPPAPAAPAPSPAPRQRKLTYAEQLELAALPEKIEALEAEQSAIHQRLNDTSLYSNPMLLTEITDRLSALESELAEAYARWEGLEGG